MFLEEGDLLGFWDDSGAASASRRRCTFSLVHPCSKTVNHQYWFHVKVSGVRVSRLKPFQRSGSAFTNVVVPNVTFVKNITRRTMEGVWLNDHIHPEVDTSHFCKQLSNGGEQCSNDFSSANCSYIHDLFRNDMSRLDLFRNVMSRHVNTKC